MTNQPTLDEIEKMIWGCMNGDTQVTEVMTYLADYIQREVVGWRVNELKRTIAYFDDEGRESKDVLRAFEKNRTQYLLSTIKVPLVGGSASHQRKEKP